MKIIVPAAVGHRDRLRALGLGDDLIGVTDECDLPLRRRDEARGLPQRAPAGPPAHVARDRPRCASAWTIAVRCTCSTPT